MVGFACGGAWGGTLFFRQGFFFFDRCLTDCLKEVRDAGTEEEGEFEEDILEDMCVLGNRGMVARLR